MLGKGFILGCGNPLLDICAEVPQELLDKYGVTMNNAILAEEKHLPLYDEMVQQFCVEYIAGGATQNSIRVAQWMLQEPGATSYIGSIGDDAFGQTLRTAATNDGVDVHYHVDKETATGTCAVLIKEHERSLIANLAAANKYQMSHLLSDEVQPIWKSAKIVYISGFFLTVSPDSILHLAKHCHEHEEKTFAMNLAAPFLAQFFSEPMLAALPYCDIIVGNEGEAAAFAQTHNLADSSPAAVAKHLSEMTKVNSKRPRIAIITQGPDETIVASGGVTTTYPVPAVPESELVDLNGAGDAFVGGLLAYLSKGKPIEEAVAAGHYAAGFIVRRSGCVLPGKPDFHL